MMAPYQVITQALIQPTLFPEEDTKKKEGWGGDEKNGGKREMVASVCERA